MFLPPNETVAKYKHLNLKETEGGRKCSRKAVESEKSWKKRRFIGR
jgi:hypothetical protein